MHHMRDPLLHFWADGLTTTNHRPATAIQLYMACRFYSCSYSRAFFKREECCVFSTRFSIRFSFLSTLLFFLPIP